MSEHAGLPSLLIYKKDWSVENPSDPRYFPTIEHSETQVRQDIQQLYDEAKDKINELITYLGSDDAAYGIEIDTVSGLTATNVQGALEQLKSLIDANTADKHSHSNKALLDSYNQTNTNIADAISQKHSHSNKAALDNVTGQKISDWDTVAATFSFIEDVVVDLDSANNSSVPTAKAVKDSCMVEGESYVTAGREEGSTLGTKATVEGHHNVASGPYSHAEGRSTEATGWQSHAEGWDTVASGADSHAEGQGGVASGYCAHAEGLNTEASGNESHAGGQGSVASGLYSSAEGFFTNANHRCQRVFGALNEEDTSESSVNENGNFVEIVGGGDGELDVFGNLINVERRNIRTLDWDGNEELAGHLTLGAGPTEAKHAATKEYVDKRSVALPMLQGTYKLAVTQTPTGFLYQWIMA